MIRYVVALALCAMAGWQDHAKARGFTVSDFGAVASDPVCVQKGRLMFQRFGAQEIKATSWTVNAYGMARLDSLDAALVCAYGPNNRTQVSVVLHSSSTLTPAAHRREMLKRLREIWDAL